MYVDSKVRTAEANGETKGILSTLVGLVKDKILTIPQAAQRANMTVEEFEEKSGLKDE